MARPLRPEDLFSPLPHPVETIANLDAISIVECGEPLVQVEATPGLRTTRPMRLREGAFARLCDAASHAQREGLTLLLLDAYRSPARQRTAHSVARGVVRVIHPTWPRSLVRELANKYVATPDAIAPPPHLTGGAIDVHLLDRRGRRLGMGRQARTDHPAAGEAAHGHRRLLADLLVPASFSNYEEEWWHWSYGDSGWALRTGAPHAIYGRALRPLS